MILSCLVVSQLLKHQGRGLEIMEISFFPYNTSIVGIFHKYVNILAKGGLKIAKVIIKRKSEERQIFSPPRGFSINSIGRGAVQDLVKQCKCAKGRSPHCAQVWCGPEFMTMAMLITNNSTHKIRTN